MARLADRHLAGTLPKILDKSPVLGADHGTFARQWPWIPEILAKEY
jgi:hypothetical protein